jgi:hypothetical protein
MDAYKLIGQISDGSNSLMNAHSQSCLIIVACANDNAGVRFHMPVQADKMHSIVSNNRSALRDCEGKHVCIGHALVRLAGFLCGEHVMAQRTKRDNHRSWEILVGVKARHALRFLIFANHLRDLLGMSLPILPCRVQVGLSEIRETLQNARVRHSQLPAFHQAGYGVTRLPNARLSTAHARRFFDPTRIGAQNFDRHDATPWPYYPRQT